jgi:outer membrane lipoprotein-sorting protein
MRRLRTAPARRLTVILALASALALTAGIAQGALTGAGPTPSPKALANAILDAFNAPEPDGLTAQIHFTNDLLPSGSLPDGMASPLASGADGRLWMQKSGDFRVELQSDAGDAQIVAVGDNVTIYDASSNTLYRLTLPGDAKDVTKPAREHDEKLTLARVQKALRRLANTWTISGAEPTSTAGQPTYTVRISPKDDGGLLGAAALAWDAVRGAPLRAAVYAQGKSDPVLELEATDVSYDAVADSDVRVAPPAGANVVDLSPDDAGRAGDEHARHGKRDAGRAGVEGLAAVRDRLGIDLHAPATLAGLPRKEVRLVTLDGEQGALTIYGEGLGAIAVLQRKAKPARADEDKRGERALRLPEINIDGATGSELATALGTVVTFERDGIAYVVAGSVPPVAAENAARGLK